MTRVITSAIPNANAAIPNANVRPNPSRASPSASGCASGHASRPLAAPIDRPRWPTCRSRSHWPGQPMRRTRRAGRCRSPPLLQGQVLSSVQSSASAPKHHVISNVRRNKVLIGAKVAGAGAHFSLKPRHLKNCSSEPRMRVLSEEPFINGPRENHI